MTDTRGDDAPRGVAIDIGPMPRWVKAYLSSAQLQLDVGLQWASLMRLATNMSDIEANTAQALFISTIGKEGKKAWPSIPELMAWTKIRSKATQIKALDGLEAKGWILREASGPRRAPAPKSGRGGKGYRLSWPLTDCLTQVDGPAQCGQMKKDGHPCTVRAGKGTTHPGEGPCWRHGGIRNTTEPEPPTEQETVQPVNDSEQPEPAEPEPPALRMVQPLNGSPSGKSGDTGHRQPPMLQLMVQPLNANGSTVDPETVQPLNADGSTVEPQYVKSSLEECDRGVTGAWRSSGAEVEGTPPPARPGQEHDHLTPDDARRILAELSDTERTWALHRARVNASAGRTPRTDEQLLVDAAKIARRRSA